jgi:tryptophan 2,3-dioxygenase
MPAASTFPFDAVIETFRRTGKHFVPANLLDELEVARRAIKGMPGRGQEWDVLERFLRTALDKRDGCYDYLTYIGADLLFPPRSLRAALDLGEVSCERDRLTSALVADAMEFELRAVEGRTDLLPRMRPDRQLAARRIRLALRAGGPSILRCDIPYGQESEELFTRARDLAVSVRAQSSVAEQRILQLSMLPVYVVHDEYLFIRVLQLFETTFAFLVAQLRATIAALGQRGDAVTAVQCLGAASSALRESAPLFSLLSTMQVVAFQTFRAYTEGASAIQSRNYKLLESLCRRPDPERLESIAYRSTPEVRHLILEGQLSLDDVMSSNLESQIGDRAVAGVRTAMSHFSAAMSRWKQTHYRLAKSMLGDKAGTGYTEGTPYLRAVREIPVFRSVHPSPVTEEL